MFASFGIAVGIVILAAMGWPLLNTHPFDPDSARMVFGAAFLLALLFLVAMAKYRAKR